MTEITLKVKANDPVTTAEREAIAKRVIDDFGPSLPSTRLLCFLDDEDPAILKGGFGPENRGIYGPIHDSTPLATWPEYVTDCIRVDDNVSFYYPRVVDDLVYLYGSTCDDEIGLTMTLAHELQHTIQHGKARKVWAANSLIRSLDRKIVKALKLTWADIPIEHEARIASKRVADGFFGEQRVVQYIDKKIAEHVTEADVADWQFVRTLTASSSVDLVGGTQLLFERLKDYRAELASLLQETKDNPDFRDFDLEAYFIAEVGDV